MTAYFGYADNQGAYILSDTAACANDGILHEVTSKVRWNAGQNLAVVGAGDAWLCSRIAEVLCSMADAVGDAEAALRMLPATVRDIGKQFDDWKSEVEADEDSGANLLVATFNHKSGGQILEFRTSDGFDNGKLVPAFETIKVRQGGTHVVDLQAAGVELQLNGKPPLRKWLDYNGGTLMELARHQRQSGKHYDVGGVVELTVLSSRGARRSELKRWPEDQIGMPIAPI